MRSLALLIIALAFPRAGAGAGCEAAHSRRFYDFASVSATNPVVARIDGSIELPVSEFMAFRKAMKPATLNRDTTLAQKKASLDELLGDYLLVLEACRIGAEQHPAFISRMRGTEIIMLSDFLTAQEVESKAKTDEEYRKRLQEFNERLFEAAQIVVSNEAYEKLKQAAKLIDAVNESTSDADSAAQTARPSRARIGEIIANLDNSILARYNGIPITVKEVLAIYAQLRAKPRLEIKQELIDLIKPLILSGLMAEEARKRCIDKLPDFCNRLDQNRNVLLRIHMRGMIQAQAVEAMNKPDYERQVQQWYQENREKYSAQPPDGTRAVADFEKVRERVEADYSVELRDRLLSEKILALRKLHRVEINEKVLNQL